MGNLAAFSDSGFFHLDKITDFHLVCQNGARTEIGKRTDIAEIADITFVDDGVFDMALIADDAVVNFYLGTNLAAGADNGFAF